MVPVVFLVKVHKPEMNVCFMDEMARAQNNLGIN